VTDISIKATPPQIDTFTAFPDDTVAALDLLGLTLKDRTGWHISVVLETGITLTATPATAPNGDTE
jgi:hypothetical protein